MEDTTQPQITQQAQQNRAKRRIITHDDLVLLRKELCLEVLSDLEKKKAKKKEVGNKER